MGCNEIDRCIQNKHDKNVKISFFVNLWAFLWVFSDEIELATFAIDKSTISESAVTIYKWSWTDIIFLG